MRVFQLFLLIVFVLLVVTPMQNSSGEDNPADQQIVGKHVVLTSGSFYLDMENLDKCKLRMLQTPPVLPVEELHKWSDLNPIMVLSRHENYVHMVVQITNPLNVPIYDLRIIYLKLNGVRINNAFNYTNYLDPPGGPHVNLFQYFTGDNDFELYDPNPIPLKPGDYKYIPVYLDVDESQSTFVSFAIEGCIGGHSGEPISIENIFQRGEVSSNGGAISVSCTVLDRQNDLKSIDIVENDISSYEMPMIHISPKDSYAGNIPNTEHPVPGPYSCWIRARSDNPDNIELWRPFTVNVTENAAPKNPYHQADTGTRKRKKLMGPAIKLDDLSSEIPAQSWIKSYETIKPKYAEDEPILIILKMANSDIVNDACLNIKWEESNRENAKSRWYTTIEPDQLFFRWEQMEPSSPIGAWDATFDNTVRCPVWLAPDVDKDTKFKFKVTVTKGNFDPPLETEAFMEFTVKDD